MELCAGQQVVRNPVAVCKGFPKPGAGSRKFTVRRVALASVGTGHCGTEIRTSCGGLSSSVLGSQIGLRSFSGKRLAHFKWNPLNLSGTKGISLTSRGFHISPMNSLQTEDFGSVERLQNSLSELSAQSVHLLQDASANASKSLALGLQNSLSEILGQSVLLLQEASANASNFPALERVQNSLSQLSAQSVHLLQEAPANTSNLPDLGRVQISLSELLAQSVNLLLWASDSASKSPAVEQLANSASKLINLAENLGSQGSKLIGGANFESPVLVNSSEKYGTQLAGAVSTFYHGLGVSDPTLTATALAVATASAVALVSLKGTSKRGRFVEGEDIPLRYNPAAISAFFKRRPVDVLLRSLKIMSQCSALTISIILDMTLEKYSENEELRARQLVDLIARLGPTAIKIGQALSIRPDLLSVVYLEELQKLQDRVPPFPNDEARNLIRQGLGRSAEEVFSEISEAPIAAASLGQVYKAKLRETGKTVAVKVQRPGVLEGISMDLFLLRAGAFAFQALPGVQSDLVGLLDTWAVRFYDELDYIQEARNQRQFAENMRALPNVTVPTVYNEYTSRKVLTTEWIEGEKLSESRAGDLLLLVSTALNCYLMQLLETGFLHADPHPGNLLRTPDGRLCVLDFGLMTQVTEDQRYSLIEYISHLVNADYARVAEDLVRLGFVPPELEDPEKTTAVVPQLSRVLGQLVQGGGARKINIQQVSDDLMNMSKEYVFVLPPYFALILRAFSVLEGIGLEADPDYTIVDECYPYISKRLLTDDSPRARAALKYFLYGGQGQLDVKRVEEIVGGFQSFREVMTPAGQEQGRKESLPSIDPSTKEALKLIFAPEGSYVQELLLTELARAVDALSREALAEFWRLIASTLRIPGLPVPASLFPAPGSWPLPVPGFLFGMTSVATLSEDDQRSLETVKRLWALTEPFLVPLSPLEILAFSQESWPFFLDLVPGVTTAAQRFTTILLQRQALRFADDLDGTNSVETWDNDAMASARNIQPMRLFSLVRRENFE